jgi:hypothetical protein
MRWFAAARQGTGAESWGKRRAGGLQQFADWPLRRPRKNGNEASSRHRRQRGSPSDAAKLASGLAERAI